MPESTAVALCRQTIAAGSRSFALASKLLPAGVRDEAAVLYTWCRRTDDAIDLAAPAERPAALARLRAELDDVYAGRVAISHDVALAAFQEVVHARAIPRHYPEELLAGMAMDATGHRYRSLEDLHRYGYRVAGVVGLMMSHVMGVRDARALVHAAHLGMAMQLTNICRDVVEDWALGRLYLPAELLERHGGGWLVGRELEGDPLPAEARAPLALVARDLLAEADRLYASGDRGLAALSFRAGLGVRAARLIYRSIGRVIRGRDYDVTRGRAVVSTATKLGLAAWALVRQVVLLPRALLGFRPAPLDALVRFPDDVLPG